MITPPYNPFNTRCPVCNMEIRGIESENPYKTLFNSNIYECVRCKAKLKWKRGITLGLVGFGIIFGSLALIIGAAYQISQSGELSYTSVAIFGLGGLFVILGLFSVPFLRLENVE